MKGNTGNATRGHQRMRAAAGAARIPVTVIASILISISVFFTVLLLTQGTFRLFHVVYGESMHPQVRPWDAVVLKEVQPPEIQAGDVIVFADPEGKGRMVIHRVVEVKGTGGSLLFETKGDNNPVHDPVEVKPAYVVGKVAMRIPGFGMLLDFFTTPRGYLVCIALPAFWALLLMLLLGRVEKVTGHY